MPLKPHESHRDPESAPSPIVPRLLRIPDAARYLSCTFGFAETLMRERTIPVVILGKRHLFDRVDLIERIKAEQNAT
jgi:hypothetical protein